MFDLKITITGICAFVENSRGTGPRVLVLMPSTDVDRNAADDEPLCPHESYIELGLTRFPLKGYRVSFVQEGGLQNLPIPLPLPIATPENVGLINFEDSGYPGVPDPDMVSSAPKAPVVAQLELEKGSIGFVPARNKWHLNPARPDVQVAHEVVVTLSQLDKAKVLLKSFNGSGSMEMDLTPASTAIQTVSLKIVNTCKRITAPVGNPRRDRDFKWYYELIASSANKASSPDSRAASTSDDLPIPRTDFPLIGGNNCFPTRLGVIEMAAN